MGKLRCAFYFFFEAKGFGALPALIFAHRFLAAAASFALCASDVPPFFFGAAGALTFAHLAF